MSGPYRYPQGPTGRSPFDRPSPMSSQPSAQPQSYRTNVNRAKTKKWTQAPEYSYDGDDWGELDEYDEYGTYDEGPPPVEAAGVQQEGQPVGEAGETAQSFTSPESSNVAVLNRANSFDAGDERRTFSSGKPATRPPPAPETSNDQAPPNTLLETTFSENVIAPQHTSLQTPVPPTSDNGQRSPPELRTGHNRYTETDPEAVGDAHRPLNETYGFEQSGGGKLGDVVPGYMPSATGYGARRDFSQPSALPAPLQMRGSAVRQLAGEPSSSGQFPPRKSSLSQRPPTSVPESTQLPDEGMSQGLQTSETQPDYPQVDAPRPTKPLPFIRPSDIYKRMEEEREKERRSSESSGPSALETGIEERVTNDNLARSVQRNQSLDQIEELEGERQLRPTQSSVQERQNKYEFQGFTVPNPVLARAIGANVAQPATPEIDEVSTLSSRLPDTAIRTDTNMQQSHVLPPVSRMSAFGSDFWPNSQPVVQQTCSEGEQPKIEKPAESEGLETIDHRSSRGPLMVSTHLQHPPSTGLQSVVDQAFDRKDDRSVPPTPLSSRPSQSSKLGSQISRSGSDSTAGISPIMSGVPGSTFLPLSALSNAANASESRPQAIAEESVEASSPYGRPASAGTLRAIENVHRDPSPAHSRKASADSEGRNLKAVYRGDVRSPSPGYSPARSATIEAPTQTLTPEVGEMATVSPSESTASVPHIKSGQPSELTTDTSISGKPMDLNTHEANLAAVVNRSPHGEIAGVAEPSKAAQVDFLDSRLSAPFSVYEPVSPTSSPSPRAESPSKGRVRELASRFGEVSDSRRNSQHSTASKGSVSFWERSQEDLSIPQQDGGAQDSVRETSPFKSSDSAQSRPVSDRARSFRPRLPGEWISYATTAAPSTPSASDQYIERRLRSSPDRGRSKDAVQETPAKINDTDDDEDIDITPTTNHRRLKGEETDRSPRGAMASVAAAGQALADSLMRSVGLSSQEASSDTSSEAEDRNLNPTHAISPSMPQDRSHGDLFFRPQAVDWSTPSVGSSVAPTPPPKDTPRARSRDRLSAYIPSAHANTRGDSDGRELSMDSPREARPPMVQQLSMDASPDDQESDKLRKEIVRSFSPLRTGENSSREDVTASGCTPSNDVKRIDKSRESTVLPSEHDSYWAEEKEIGGGPIADSISQSSMGFQSGVPPQMVQPPTAPVAPDVEANRLTSLHTHDEDAATRVERTDQRRSFLNKRFSWENEQEEVVQPSDSRVQPLEATHEQPLPERSYIADTNGEPQHSPSFQKSDEFHDLQPQRSEVMPQLDAPSPISELDATEERGIRSRLSLDREISPPAHMIYIDHTVDSSPAQSHHTSEGSHLAGSTEQTHATPAVPPKSPRASIDHSRQSLGNRSPEYTRPVSSLRQSSGHVVPPTPPISYPRLPPFREILAIKSPTERIASYKTTREQFANMNTGLADWITATLTAHPEHNNITSIATARPAATTSALPGTIRVAGHKVSPSISKIVKMPTTNNVTASQPYYQQYLDSAATISNSGTSPTMTAQPGSPQGSPLASSGPGGVGAGKEGGVRSTSGQMQLKGKDLLHSAGKAGKGLLAKGRSRFKGSGGTE